VERLAISGRVEEPTSILGVREAGDVGAPATLDSSPPQREWKRTEKGSCLDIWIDCNHIRCSSGRVHLRKERKKKKKKKKKEEEEEEDGEADCRQQKHYPQEERNDDALLGYAGQTALGREQCDMMPESCNLPICWVGIR
jgi:hypothetical protein